MASPVMSDLQSCQTDDITRRPARFLLFYGLPTAVLIASQFFTRDAVLIAWIWAAGMTVMGLACLANARRCHRVHCYFTGPWMLLMAALFLLYATGWLPLSGTVFAWLVNGAWIGILVLWFGSEMVWGRYFGLKNDRG